MGRSSSQLDDIARAVADGVPRRVIVGRIAAFMGAMLVGDPELALGAKKRCPKGRRHCGDRCCKPGYVCKKKHHKHRCVCPKPRKVCNGHCCATGEHCVNGRCRAVQQQQPEPQPQPTPTPEATCTDGAQNGNETDVDCGGPTCPKCAEGKRCSVATDCATGVCSGGVCVAPPPTCSDDLCGAQHNCPACANGKACAGGADCASGHCSGGVCVQCESAANCTAAAAGSCQQAVCTSGVCGFAADDSNAPASSSCATGTCTGGVPGVSFVAAGTPASSPSCSAGALTQYTCDGNGNVAETQTSCSPYVCADSTACYGSCGGNAECAAGYVCSGAVCVPRQCTTDSQCGVANGTGRCNQGICEVASCNAGYGDCDGRFSTGCETNLNSSVQSCGTCGHACGPYTNATAVCLSGTCKYTCNPGYLDCDNNPANGCEFMGTTCP
jgi:hypothetical protein